MTNEARLGYTNQLNFFVPYTLDKGYPAKLGWQFAKSDNFPIINITNFNNSQSAIPCFPRTSTRSTKSMRLIHPMWLP